MGTFYKRLTIDTLMSRCHALCGLLVGSGAESGGGYGTDGGLRIGD